MQRNCPLCARSLEDVALRGGVIHCCPNCSIAWRSGAGTPTVSHAITRSGTALVCPDCGDRALVPMGATAHGEEWRCIACHGRLVRVAASAVSPPPPEPSASGAIAGILVRSLAEAALFILEGMPAT